MIGVAFAVTTFFNRFKMPTSTIQILVFSVVGVTLATSGTVRWGAIGRLAVGLGRRADRRDRSRLRVHARPRPVRARWRIGAVLVAVGAVAAFAMGANDVSNASGALVGTGTFTPLAAGAIGGAGIAVGVLTWGKPLLRRVAFEIVEVDRAMATAAQLVQAGSRPRGGRVRLLHVDEPGARRRDGGRGLRARARDRASRDAALDPPGLGARPGGSARGAAFVFGLTVR